VAVNPALVTLVREFRGLTQGELATRAGLTQGYLSKFENGLAELPQATLERIAAQLDWPVSFFFRNDVREGFTTACVFHRKQSSVPMSILRRVEATANVLRMGLRPLVEEVDLDAEFDFPVLDIDEYAGDTARIAQMVRAAWRLPYGPIPNLAAAVEAAGGILYTIPFGTRRFDAVSQWARQTPPVFLLNDATSGDRLRFSLAHEIGHIVMHRLPTPDMEREAQRFASDFLMPARDIRGDLVNLDLAKAGHLKQHWKVSMAALVYRARDLGVITDWRAKSLFMEISRRGWRLNEPGDIRIEQPTLARAILDVHRREHDYSLEELSELSGLPAPVLSTYMLNERAALAALK
jgi:Zn-dependent peptidase ImmA (M78 family)/transcriptional regulator with XRE-family HTH domain